MNLNAIVAPLVSAITPSVQAVWSPSLGYTTAANGTRVPSYAAPVCISIAVQALTGPDLDHVDAMNLQGVKRAAYIDGQVEGVNRPALKGGDLIT
ncbi:MAG: hypothetical protein KGP14_15165, partial [Betaproteobacteria bacterium]|nr:hypothetical protein [Betaproteobacteria bacterium]